MNSIYVLDIGYTQSTKLYKLKLVPVVEFNEGKTLSEIKDGLKGIDVKNIIVNPAHPHEIDSLKESGFNVTKLRLL